MLRRGSKASPKEMKNAALIVIGMFACGVAALVSGVDGGKV